MRVSPLRWQTYRLLCSFKKSKQRKKVEYERIGTKTQKYLIDPVQINRVLVGLDRPEERLMATNSPKIL